MNLAVNYAVLISLFVYTNAQQRVAPGVPPQQYQNTMQHVPQHVPQQQMHMQQVPQMQQPSHQQQQYQMPQQVHQQQMPQQVPMQNTQQVPVHQQQHVQHHAQVQGQQHGHHPHGGQILNAANIAQEKQHIQEHMDVPIDTSKMTDQELQFHYFKMHDADNNNKLDGCELIKSLIHWHDEPSSEQVSHTDSELIDLVDPILNMMDQNLDGFVEYHEFKTFQN